MDIDTNTVAEQTNPRKIPKWAKVLIILPILGVLAAAVFFAWSSGIFSSDKSSVQQQVTSQAGNNQYKIEKYNFGFSYPSTYEVFETLGESIMGSRDSISVTFTSTTGSTGSGSRLTFAFYDWSGDLDSFVSEKIGADSQIKPQECPKNGDCRALVGSAAAKFPLQFVFKSANGIVGIQLKDAQGVLLGKGISEPLRTVLTTLRRE